MFHSALSPLINLGLITPEEILIKLKKIEGKVPINSFEGYVRQIIGWREFMRGIYRNFDYHSFTGIKLESKFRIVLFAKN